MKACFTEKHRPFFFKLSLVICFIFVNSLAFSQTVDCSVAANCTDAYCNFAANIEKGCRCFDGLDNDADGKIDKADPNCATYYGLTFVGEGSDCTITPPGVLTPFDLVNAPITSQQNTADTQSKVSVGDVDGDGKPDAVITSKWNSEIRVVATTSGQADGTQAGAVKSSFNLSGNAVNTLFPNNGYGNGACKPDRLLFEHENLIADIDGNGKAEMFGIVSNRSGNPSTPPTCFYLVGFKYKSGSLETLFSPAISVGTDRPGTFGIADMDGDGKAEIYLRDRIYAAETGKLLAQAGGDWDLDVTSAPVAVNITGDTKMELVCGTKIYSIPTLTNRNPATPATLTLIPNGDMNAIGTVDGFVKLTTDPVEYGVDTHSSCSVADIDKDGVVDIIISGALNSVTGNTTVFYWNYAKQRVTYFSPPDQTYPEGWPWGTGRVNIGDADGDGLPNLTFISGNRLWCMKVDQTTGALTNQWGSYREINDTRSGVLTVTIYDFDNDGKPEVVYRDSQQLAVIDGVGGTTLEWSAVCQSHTYTEGPIIADVNGDGGTDICVACNTSNSFDIEDPIQQQALGQFRLYYSSANEWLPTRKVWNQPGYFVVNINDDLTLPFPQLDQNLVFGTSPCPNGLPGPQMPMNVFLNQVPNLSANGCPEYRAPDLSYFGDVPNPACLTDPTLPGCDIDGDGIYEPTVEVIPPICGNKGIQVRFNIINDGDLPISGNIPVSFYKADPQVTTQQSDKLYASTIALNNLAVGATYTSPWVTFDGTGGTFRLYIVLNNSGATLPININVPSQTECRIDNNFYSLDIVPNPFTTTVEKIKDNFKCNPAAPNTGELRVRVYKAGVEVTDYTPYTYQWYTGPITSPVIINGATAYNLTALDNGEYTVRVRDAIQGCNGDFVSGIITNTVIFPTVQIDTIRQTKCNPPNGSATATVTDPGGNLGYTFAWYDVGLNPLGITGSTAANLVAGNYKVIVSKSGCDRTFDALIKAPIVGDAEAQVIQHVEDCLNPNSGIIQADVRFSGAVQDPTNYTFNWFYFNGGIKGSILPNINGTGPTRTGLPVGRYIVEVKDNITGCNANLTPDVTITSAQVLPVAAIQQIAQQTSCDPLNPNGILTASASAGTLVSPTDFTFQWFKGDNTIAPALTTVTGAKGETLNKVSGGGVVYTVKVTTAKNCSDTEKFTITEDVVEPVITITQVNPNSVCDITKASQPYNGSIQATVTFKGVAVTLPNANYKFTWYDGATATVVHTPAPASTQTPSLTGLKDGDYTAIVERTDLACISDPDTETVAKATINPLLSATSTGSNNCDATLVPDGTVTVTVTNTGVSPGPFTYQWYDGNAVGVSPLGVANNGTTATAIKVGGPTGAPRPYTVEVLNTATGCVNNTSQFVADNSVIPVLTSATTDNTICAPATNFNGTFKISLANPVGTYVYPTDFTFTWFKSNTNDPLTTIATPTTTTDLVAKTITLTKLQDGPYTVVAKNTKTGCTSAPAPNVVGNGKVFPSLVPAATGSNNCNAALTPDGTATVAVSVTTGPYTFQWYTGSGDPATLTAMAGKTTQSIVNVGGPNLPVGSAPHFYTVLVTDTGTGCTNYTTATVPDNSVVPILSTGTTPNGICAPAANFGGKMTVAVDNVPVLYTMADYEFTWKNSVGTTIQGPSVSTLLDKIDAGTYTVSGINTKTGCQSAVATNTVANTKVFPLLAPSSTGSHNCKVDVPAGINNDGTASVIASGTPGGYSYQWYTGSGDPTLLTPIAGATSASLLNVGGPNVPVGTAPRSYTVLVTDVTTGCPSYVTSSVADLSVDPILSTGTTPNDICSPASNYAGTLAVTLSNAQVVGTFPTDFTFKWYADVTNDPADLIGSPTTTTGAGMITMTKLDVGSYTVEAYNTKTGCSSLPATNQVANGKVNPSVVVTTTGSSVCTENVVANGTATGTVTNLGVGAGLADGPFTLQWYKAAVVDATKLFGAAVNNDVTGTSTINNVGGPDISASAPFIYTLEVTDNLTGCKGNSAGTVADISEKPTLTLTKQDNTICDPALITSGPQDNNGQVNITAVDHNGAAYGGADLTYKWFDVDPITSALTANNGSTTVLLDLLPAAKYAATVTITSLDCTSDPEIIEVLDDLPTLDIVPTVVDNTNCPAGGVNANGSAAVLDITEDAASKPLANYVYEWYDGPIVAGAARAETSQTGPVQIQGPQTFTVRVTNKTTGCRLNEAMTVTDVKVTPTISVALVQDNTQCTGDPNGELIATPANQGGTFLITWTGGTGVAAVGTTTIANDTYEKLAAGGPYFAKVKNTVTGCESQEDSKSIVDDLTYPVISFTIQEDQTSCGAPNGRLEAQGDGTTVGRNFEWFTGVSTAVGNTLAVDAGDGVNLIDDLASGDYTVRVTIAATGCASIESPYVPEVLTFPDISLAIANNFTSCSAPDGAVTPTINNASGTFTIYYVFTPLDGTPPVDPDAVEASPTTTKTNTTNYGNLNPGFVTALVINETTSCRSNITTEQIQDLTADYDLTMDNILAGGNCTDPGGGADVAITGGSGLYNYDWRKGLPTNTSPINFYDPADYPQFAGTQPNLSTTDKMGSLKLPVADMTLTAGAYSVVVTDQANGCGEVFTINIPFVGLPDVLVDPTNLTRCDIDNGEIDVEVTDVVGTNVAGYRIKFFSGLAPILANQIGADEDGPSVLIRNRATLAAGDYYVEVYDKTPANIGCPLGFTVNLVNDASAPLVSINDIQPNTSCDPLTDADGQVDVLVETVAGDLTAKQYFLSTISPLPVGMMAQPNTQIGTGLSGQTTGLIPGFKPQSIEPFYTIRVTDNISKCFTDLPVSFQDQQVVPSDLNLAITPETLCANLANNSNGKAVASLLDLEPVTHFNFTWDNEATLAGPNVFGPTLGTGAVTGGQEINRTNATAANWTIDPLDDGFGVGNRTYYVQAERIDWGPLATGVGCKTSVIQVVIPDEHVSPDMTLTPKFDSFCLATAANDGVGDGEIDIVADADPAGAAGNQVPAAGFTIDWDPFPSTAGQLPTDNVMTATHTIGELGDGTYTVTVRNATNHCTVENTTVISPAPYVLEITDFSFVNQRICNEDGYIEVTEVTLTDNSAGGPQDDVDSQPLGDNLNALYTFDWYTNATLTAGTELKEGVAGGGAQIVGRQLSNDADKDLTFNEGGDYQAMAAGTYYVVATRNDPTVIGFGCPALPISVTIEDKHINPLPSLVALSNTSCLPAGPGEGEIRITVSDGTLAPFSGGNYTYTFIAPGPMPAAGPALNLNNNPQVGDGIGGGNDDDFVELIDNVALGDPDPYTISVENNITGCVVNAFATIIKNATPVFVKEVATTDEINCFPTGDGSITVTKVSLKDRDNVSFDFVPIPGAGQGDTDNFDFHWTKVGDGFTQITTGGNGHVLNSTTYDVTAPGFATNIGAGTYTVMAERKTGSPGAGCKSVPFQVIIQDKKINPVVTLTPFSNTSCNANFEGEIKIKVTDVTTAAPPIGGFKFNYNWTASATPALPVGTITMNNDGNEANNADADYVTALQDGAYSIRATNVTTQCFADKSTTVVKNAAPVFVQAVTVADQILCGPDGSIRVDQVSVDDRTGATTNFTTALPNGGQNMITDFQFEWKRVGDTNNYTLIMNSGVAPAGATLDNSNYVQGAGAFNPIFGAGTYTVTARRKAGSPGANCTSAPYTVTIQDKRVFPVVTLTPFANTSCSNNIVDFEGAIKVKVTDANSKSINPDLYTYNWTASATPTVLPLGLQAGTSDGDEDATDGDDDNPTFLKEGGYSITVINTQTNCPGTASTTIFQNSTPVITQLVDAANQIMCSNDGRLEVKQVKVIDRDGTVKDTALPIGDPNKLNFSDFDFEWSRTTTGNLVSTGDGNLGAVSGGTVLDNVAYPTISFDTYYVVTRRTNGAPGKNCPSAPYKIDIQDKRVYPSVALTPLANTSCDPAFFEGEIRINVTDATPVAPPIGGFRYRYDWTASATAALPVGTFTTNNDGDGFGGIPAENDGVGLDSDGDHLSGLKENDPAVPASAYYRVTVTNATTSCQSIGSTQIFKNSTPVFTQSALSTAQVLCNNDGSISVQEVRVIDRDGNVESNLTGDFPLSDFAFIYHEGTIGNIVLDELDPQPAVTLDVTSYAGVQRGTYYVVAKRTGGGPGRDCESAPYKVDIDDQRVYPTVAFVEKKNSSCSQLKPNGSLLATASERDGTTDNYTFAWTLDAQPLAVASPTSIVNNASPNSTVTNALDGDYIVTATNTLTGCPYDASFTVRLDQTMSTPNIIEVLTIDPLDCNPSAQAEVTKITIGSNTNSSLIPPAATNVVSGPALLNFNYLWFKGTTNAADQYPIGGPFVTKPCIGPGCITPTVGLTDGTYYVFVQDPTTDCQSGPKEVIINPDDIVYPVVLINQTQLQISCPITNGTGELQATADGQTSANPNYDFEWFASLDGTAPSVGNNSILSNLVQGDYSVTATNLTTSCSTTELFIVRNQSAEFLPELSMTTEPRRNCLAPDGEMLVREVNYDPNSEYPFDPPSFTTELYVGANANVTVPGSVMTNVSGFNLNWFRNALDVGPYTIKITDNNTGCITVGEVSVGDDRTPPVVVIREQNPLTHCDPVPPNGVLEATADNGNVGGYTFQWYRGATATPPLLQTSNLLIGERDGSFTVHVINDFTGCASDKTGSITDAHVDPPEPDASVVQHQTRCAPPPDGWVTVSVDGAIQGYSFNWYVGTSANTSVDFNGVDYTLRAAGQYTVTATDVITGCISDPSTVEVLEQTVTPKMKFLTTASFCEDLPAELSAGGTGTVQVQLIPADVLTDSVVWVKVEDNGLTSDAGAGSYLTGLWPGTYHAFVRTTKGCSADSSAVVPTEVRAYNLVTNNSDQINDKFVIDCISRFPNNNVKIFNRAGVKVFEIDGYNNDDKVFTGFGEAGVYTAGRDLPVGTYFFVIDKRDGSKPRTGYLELVK
jgi:hypothetical protein